MLLTIIKNEKIWVIFGKNGILVIFGKKNFLEKGRLEGTTGKFRDSISEKGCHEGTSENFEKIRYNGKNDLFLRQICDLISFTEISNNPDLSVYKIIFISGNRFGLIVFLFTGDFIETNSYFVLGWP